MVDIFWGKIIEGNKRGRTLGFPTANIKLHKKIPEGIYISTATMQQKKYRAVTFIGQAKTFHEHVYQSETYIFDFNKTIYNQWITIYLLEKIRENQQFKNADELIATMNKDIMHAKKYFTTHYV